MSNLLRRNAQTVLTVRLTALETFLLGAVLAAGEGVQLHLAMPKHVHDAVAAGILVLGVLVRPLTPAQFLAKIPPQIVLLVQAGITAIVILAQGWQLGPTWVTVLGVVLVIANTLGLGPQGVNLPTALEEAPPPPPAAKSVRKT